MSTLIVVDPQATVNAQCPCCRATTRAFEIRYTLPEFDGNAHDVLECKNCHFKFMQPMPDDDYLNNYYKQRDIYGAESDFPEDYKNAIFDKENLFHELIAPYINFSNISSNLALDFGAGSGYVVKAFKNLGFKSLGLDLNPKSPEKALRLFDVCVENRGLETFDDHSIKVFSMFEVLEHITDPASFLKKIREKISTKGIIIGTVPNYNGLGRIIFGINSSVLLQPEHVIYFDRQSLGNLLKENGFEIVFIGAKKPNSVIIDLGIRRMIFKFFGRNLFSMLTVRLVFFIKKYIAYPLANIFVEKTGKLAHGLTFVARPSDVIDGGGKL